MAISVSLMLIGLLVVIDMLCTLKLYRVVQSEKDASIKDVNARIDCVRHDITTTRMNIDSKIERAIYNYDKRVQYKNRTKAKKVKTEKATCKKK